MGFSSSTGPKEWTGALYCNVVWEELKLNTSIFAAPQDSNSTETLTLARIQTHSFYTAFIVMLQKTGEKSHTRNTIVTTPFEGDHIQKVIGLHQIQRMHIHLFSHGHIVHSALKVTLE